MAGEETGLSMRRMEFRFPGLASIRLESVCRDKEPVLLEELCNQGCEARVVLDQQNGHLGSLVRETITWLIAECLAQSTGNGVRSDGLVTRPDTIDDH